MRLRHIFFFLALILIVLFGIVQFGQLTNFLSVIRSVNVWLLLVVIVLRYIYYWTNTKYFQVYLKNFNQRVPFGTLFKDVVTMNFANTVFPTGGLSGVAILRSRLRKNKISAQTATVAQAFWLGFTVISFILLLLLSLLMLFLSNRIEQVSFRLILIALLLMLVASVAVIGLLLNRPATEHLGYFLTRPMNWLLKKFKRNALEKAQFHELINKFYATLLEFKNDWRLLVGPFWWCFVTLSIDILSLYTVFVAFGVYPNPGVVIAAFLVALVASLASIATSGIGVIEIGMVTILVGLGMSFDISFSAVIVYRVISLWLFLPFGLYYYKRTMLDEG